MKIGDKFAFVCSAYFSFEFFYNLKSNTHQAPELFTIFLIGTSIRKGGLNF